MGYYVVLQKKEMLLFGTIWMKIEDLILCRINQAYKDKVASDSLTYGLQTSQIHRV